MTDKRLHGRARKDDPVRDELVDRIKRGFAMHDDRLWEIVGENRHALTLRMPGGRLFEVRVREKFGIEGAALPDNTEDAV